MDDKVLTVFFRDQGVPTVGTAQFHRREAAFIRGEPCRADFTEELSLGAIVFVKKGLGSITARAGAVVRDVAFRASSDREDLLTVAFFVVREEFPVSPVLPEVGNQGELVNLELLVFWGMGILKSPLLQGDISADEVDQPAVLLVKILNYRE